jgi:hypothetical protein
MLLIIALLDGQPSLVTDERRGAGAYGLTRIASVRRMAGLC